MIKKYSKILILAAVGGFSYMGLELLWRARTHWSMGVVGALCFILIGGLNEHLSWDMSLLKQGVIGSCVITAAEFLFGIVLNLYLGWGVWDYSNLPLNLLGQICLPFFLLWILVSIGVVILDDYLRYYLFKEEKPHYKLI